MQFAVFQYPVSYLVLLRFYFTLGSSVRASSRQPTGSGSPAVGQSSLAEGAFHVLATTLMLINSALSIITWLKDLRGGGTGSHSRAIVPGPTTYLANQSILWQTLTRTAHRRLCLRPKAKATMQVLPPAATP